MPSRRQCGLVYFRRGRLPGWPHPCSRQLSWKLLHRLYSALARLNQDTPQTRGRRDTVTATPPLLLSAAPPRNEEATTLRGPVSICRPPLPRHSAETLRAKKAKRKPSESARARGITPPPTGLQCSTRCAPPSSSISRHYFLGKQLAGGARPLPAVPRAPNPGDCLSPSPSPKTAIKKRPTPGSGAARAAEGCWRAGVALLAATAAADFFSPRPFFSTRPCRSRAPSCLRKVISGLFVGESRL